MHRTTTEFRHPPFSSTNAVLAIHGSASSGRQWKALAEQLRGTAHVYTPDLPGYGTSAGDTGDRLEALTRIVEQQTEGVHLVAHSFGGAIALCLAHAHPDHVASVTLYDPITAQPDVTGRYPLPGALDTIWRRYAHASPPKLMSRFYDFWASGNTWKDLAPDQQGRLLRDHPGLYRDITEITSGQWAIPRYAYRGPVKIFRGQLSPRVTAEIADHIARAHRKATVIPLPGMGHFAPLTQADALNAHLIPAILNSRAPVSSRAA